MSRIPPEESALLLRVPIADPVVGRHRDRYDQAAQVGVPAHITVAYPFKPVADLTHGDHERLAQVISEHRAVDVVMASTDWFSEDVVYLAPQEPKPIKALTRTIEGAFPDFPIYGAAFEEVVPHATIGHGHPTADLREAERDVLRHLPLTQMVTEVQLWAGPALASRRGRWQLVRVYPLAAS